MDIELRSLMVPASEAAVEIVRGIGPETFAGPTPCVELDVRDLVNHLISLSGERAFQAGVKRPQNPDEGYDHTADPGWAEAYARRTAEAARVWSEPAAWTGETGMSGKGLMPAPFIGGIVFGEWLFHAWDLAIATGRKPTVDDRLGEALYETTAAKADMARQYKIFGPEVHVAESATFFDRALGLAGRDPDWTA